jgi:threonine dehydrogenase-like Zn-dependent dehydrogenase
MAEYMILSKASTIHVIPEDVDFFQAVLLAEPLAVSVHALERANISPFDKILLVRGCGSIGLGLICALRLFNPDSIIVACDENPLKLDFAKQAGAHYTFTPDKLVDFIRNEDTIPELQAKGGVDISFECSGSESSVHNGLIALRKLGKFVHLGISQLESFSTNWNVISAGKELTIIGSSLGVGS